MRNSILFVLTMVIGSTTMAQTLRVATFNIRYDNPGDGINQWKNRRVAVANQLTEQQPDIIGLQEVLMSQALWLDSALVQYTREGVGRDDGADKGELCPVYYNSHKFDKIDGGTFWLSPTPEKPSKGWDAALNRICTWVYLKDRTSGQIILTLNTHFDHMGEEARMNSALLIADSMASKSKNMIPAILTGDFNSEPGSNPINVLSASFTNTQNAAATNGIIPLTPTFNGWNEAEHTECIDFIFCDHQRNPISWKVLNMQGEYLSDHYMVMSTIKL